MRSLSLAQEIFEPIAELSVSRIIDMFSEAIP
jgi:hypothetical protein